MLDDLLDEVAREISHEGDTRIIEDSDFLRDAEACGVWNPFSSMEDDALTVFIPENYQSGQVCQQTFPMFWRRHVVHGRIHLTGAVQQLRTLARLVVAVYPRSDEQGGSEYAVGGVRLGTFTNLEYGGCVFHSIASDKMPELRPITGDVAKIRTCYLAGEELELHFAEERVKGRGTDYALSVAMTTANGSKICADQETPWHCSGTVCRVVIPDVASCIHEGHMWFQLRDNRVKHPVLSMMVPRHFVFVPNVLMYSNPRIISINPKSGRKGEELWIKGEGFSSMDVRVIIGTKPAIILCSSPTLIQCRIPDGCSRELNSVWVANGNVYTRFDWFKYEDTAS